MNPLYFSCSYPTDNIILCVDSLELESISGKCLTPCEGIFADIWKEPVTQCDSKIMTEAIKAYENYKNFYTDSLQYPVGISGYKVDFFVKHSFLFTDYKFKTSLKCIRIFFDTPTFDRIIRVHIFDSCEHKDYFSKQDERAKFGDMLSAVGGTMGLLTGFSIISAVEILYFLIKIIFSMFLYSKKK